MTLFDEELDDSCEPEENVRALVSCISLNTSDEKLPEYDFPTFGSEDESSNASIASAYRYF